MKLYFMKQTALDYLKANMSTLYINYYRENTNKWITDLFDYDPFEVFIEVPDFQLAPIPTENNKKGEMDLQNCKILYTKLINISESQASDERLWAGLCHSVFYSYVRSRWNYQNLQLKDDSKDAGAILSRFFFSGGVRSGFFRNTLAKYWWVGRTAYQPKSTNKFELLDALGPDDFASKVTDLFYSYTFSSNPAIICGICKAWKIFRDNGIKLPVREYFRPALQYFNALGGGILLDVLSEEEVKDIFFEYVQQLYNDRGNIALVSVSTESEDFDDDVTEIISETLQHIRDANEEKTEIPYDEKKERPGVIVIGAKSDEAIRDAEKIMKLRGAPEKVEYGCTVVIAQLGSDKKISYNIPKKDDTTATWYGIQKMLFGKTVGYEFFAGASLGKCKIESISW